MLQEHQRAAIAAYRKGMFGYLLQITDKDDFHDSLRRAADPLLTFLIEALSYRNGCSTYEEAADRITAARDALGLVFAELEPRCKRYKRPRTDRRFTVTWDIDLHADTARAAAEQALAIHRDPDSIATVFNVTDHDTGEKTTIDLMEDAHA